MLQGLPVSLSLVYLIQTWLSLAIRFLFYRCKGGTFLKSMQGMSGRGKMTIQGPTYLFSSSWVSVRKSKAIVFRLVGGQAQQHLNSGCTEQRGILLKLYKDLFFSFVFCLVLEHAVRSCCSAPQIGFGTKVSFNLPIWFLVVAIDCCSSSPLCRSKVSAFWLFIFFFLSKNSVRVLLS